MNTHTELRGAVQHDFDTFGKDLVKVVVEAAARVRDITGFEEDEFYEEQIRQLCDLEVEAAACHEVVQQKFAEYLATANLENRVKSNISETLEKDMQAGYQRHPLRDKPQKTGTWGKWCHETGAAEPEDLDNDLQVASGAQFKNNRCVLSQKSIFDLAEPVEDSHNYIHERSFIVQHIQQARGGSVQNPANLQLQITMAELQPCRRVLREAERRRKEEEARAEDAQEVL